MPNLSQAPKQRWTPVPRISPEFQYCIGLGEGGGGVENCKVFSKSRHPEITDGNYEYHHRLCITVPRIFFPRIVIPMKLEFLKSHMATVHQNAARLRTAKTIRYRIIRGGGGGFSLLRLTGLKQCWIDVLTF